MFCFIDNLFFICLPVDGHFKCPELSYSIIKVLLSLFVSILVLCSISFYRGLSENFNILCIQLFL